jgi:nucleoid-associated protein YgaU
MINQLYNQFVFYALGAAGLVILVVIYMRYYRVVQTGNVRRMVTEPVAPAVMLLAAIIAAGLAVSYAKPRIDAMLNSREVASAVAAGDVLTKAFDGWVAGASTYSGGYGDNQTVAGGGVSVEVPAIVVGRSAAPAAAPTAAPPVPTPAATPISPLLKTVSGGHDRYTVRAGDTMSAIAAKVLGNANRYVELCAANIQRVGPNCSLRVGTEIIVPTDIQAYKPPQAKPASGSQPVVARSASPRVPVAQAASGQKTYTIAAGDSMFSIASKNGGIGRMYDICRANVSTLGGDCDQIVVGATIVIP